MSKKYDNDHISSLGPFLSPPVLDLFGNQLEFSKQLVALRFSSSPALFLHRSENAL